MSLEPGPGGRNGSSTDPAHVATALLDSKACQRSEPFGVESVQGTAVANGNETVGITAPLPEFIRPGVEPAHYRPRVPACRSTPERGTGGCQDSIPRPGETTVGEAVGEHASPGCRSRVR